MAETVYSMPVIHNSPPDSKNPGFPPVVSSLSQPVFSYLSLFKGLNLLLRFWIELITTMSLCISLTRWYECMTW